MVLTRLVHEIPDLQLTDSHRIVTLVVTGVHERLQIDRSGWSRISRDERLDLPKRRGDVCV